MRVQLTTAWCRMEDGSLGYPEDSTVTYSTLMASNPSNLEEYTKNVQETAQSYN